MKRDMAKPKLVRIRRTSPIVPALISLDQPDGLRMQAIHEGFAHEGAGLAGGVDHGFGFGGGEAHGFSTITCLPASAALIAHSAWEGWVVAI